MSDKITRLILRKEAKLETFDALAADEEWHLQSDEMRGHEQRRFRIYQPRPGAEIGWYEEHTTGVRFAWLKNAKDLEAVVARALPNVSREELHKQLAHKDLVVALDALRALTVSEGQAPSDEVCSHLASWMKHPKRAVRRSVIHLLWLAQPTSLLPAVEDAARQDEELKHKWQELAEGLRHVSGPSSRP